MHARGLAIAASALAAIAAAAPAAMGQSDDWSITIGRSAEAGGTTWTGPDGAEATWTRPSWAGQALDVLLRGTRIAWSGTWFTPGGDVTRSWSNLSEGTYTVRVDMRTVVTCTWRGMCSWGQQRKTASFTVDLTPPGTPQVIAPDGPTASTDPVRWWPVGDGGAGMARYEVLVGGAVQAELGPGACASECQVALPAAALPDGDHHVEVRAIDRVGNSARGGGVRTISDTPRVAFQSPPAFVMKGRAVTLRAAASTDNGGAIAYAWDTDGDGTFDADTGSIPAVTITPDADATVSVRATAPGGGEATAEMQLDVRPAALADEPGVSIEDGARFTRDPRVQLAIAWPDGATGMRIATDGGFKGADWRPVAPEAAITLEADPDARLPHVVYVRFRGRGIDARETYTDDIILDTVAPVVDAATATRTSAGLRLTTRARDAHSGIASLQVAQAPGRPVTTVPYAARATVRTKGARPLVRVVDRAGNESGWVRARAKRGR